MEKKIYVFMAQGFEEMEMVITVDMLRRAKLNVEIVAIQESLDPVKGSRNIFIKPDKTIKDIDLNNCIAVVLPGGAEGTNNLRNDKRVLDIVYQAYNKNILVAAICAAPTVLIAAGINKIKMTCHPTVRNQLKDVEFVEQRVIKDRNVITSQAAGTTFEFASEIIKSLLGNDKLEEVNAGVLAKL